MGNSFVIYLFLFPPCAALQSPSLPGVSGLGGGTLEFGTGQTSFFLAEPVKAFEEEEGMERRGGMQRRFGCRQDAAQRSPPAPRNLQVVRTFPSQGGKQPLPQRSSTRARQSRRGKLEKATQPQSHAGPSASSRGGRRQRPGASRGYLRAETAVPHVPRGVGRGGHDLITVTSLWQGLHVPGDRDLPQNSERNIPFAVFPLNLKPCSVCVSATVEMNSPKLLGVLFQISFPFSPPLHAICRVLT